MVQCVGEQKEDQRLDRGWRMSFRLTSVSGKEVHLVPYSSLHHGDGINQRKISTKDVIRKMIYADNLALAAEIL